MFKIDIDLFSKSLIITYQDQSFTHTIKGMNYYLNIKVDTYED